MAECPWYFRHWCVWVGWIFFPEFIRVSLSFASFQERSEVALSTRGARQMQKWRPSGFWFWRGRRGGHLGGGRRWRHLWPRPPTNMNYLISFLPLSFSFFFFFFFFFLSLLFLFVIFFFFLHSFSCLILRLQVFNFFASFSLIFFSTSQFFGWSKSWKPNYSLQTSCLQIDYALFNLEMTASARKEVF